MKVVNCAQTRQSTIFRKRQNFFKMEDAGRVLVRRVKDKGDIKNTDALQEAYELGARC